MAQEAPRCSHVFKQFCAEGNAWENVLRHFRLAVILLAFRDVIGTVGSFAKDPFRSFRTERKRHQMQNRGTCSSRNFIYIHAKKIKEMKKVRYASSVTIRFKAGTSFRPSGKLELRCKPHHLEFEEIAKA